VVSTLCYIHASLKFKTLSGCKPDDDDDDDDDKMGSHPASGGYKYRGLVLRDGGWAWG
jgi:hypothetical protein